MLLSFRPRHGAGDATGACVKDLAQVDVASFTTLLHSFICPSTKGELLRRFLRDRCELLEARAHLRQDQRLVERGVEASPQSASRAVRERKHSIRWFEALDRIGPPAECRAGFRAARIRYAAIGFSLPP